MAEFPSSLPAIAMLNSMAGRDFESALDRHVAWGLEWLDLKDFIFGKPIADLTDDELNVAAQMIKARGLSVYCLSTSLFADNVEIGEDNFRANHLSKVSRVLEIAQVLSPTFIRLVAASTSERQNVPDAVAHIRTHAPWLFALYDEAISQIHEAGFTAVIENETQGCIVSRPQEALDFFEALTNREAAKFTWDVVNMWQAGTFPSLGAYEALRPILGYIHYKGGQAERANGPLKWRSSLEEASWPVAEITAAVLRDKECNAICLNPPHGAPRPSESHTNWTQDDLEYLRALVSEAHKS